MKFFKIILISNYPLEDWVYPYGVQDTLVPSRQLYCRYSILHNQLPKNAVLNISYPRQEILSAKDETYVPLSSSPYHLHSVMEDTQHEYEHDPYLPPLSKYVNFQNRISALPNPCNVSENLPLIHDNDIWSPILYVLLIDLLNAIFFYILPFSKSIKFLETKVPTIKLQGFNLCLRH